MDFAIILAVTIVGCFALRNPLKALPVAFYAAAIAIDVVYVYGVFFGLPRAIWSPLFVLIQKCELCTKNKEGQPACVTGCPNKAIVFEER